MQVSRLSRRRFMATSGVVGVCTFGCSGASQEEFVSIFNGKDLSGWEGGQTLWVVEEGMLIGRSPGLQHNNFLATKKTYRNFILRFKIHLVNNDGNSGVQIRSERKKGSAEMIGYQADVGPTWWGSLYDESRRGVVLAQATPELIDKTLRLDAWNDYEVYANEEHIRLSINGETTADYHEQDDSIARVGVIATQIHSGPPLEVRFKNIRIRELQEGFSSTTCG